MAPITTTARSARILTLPPPAQPTLPQLQVHSQFSRRFGASTVTALVQAACDAQVPALALTDRNAMQGVLPFLRACRDAGLPPIIGAEVDDPQDARRRAVCWARSRQGFAALSALVSRRCLTPETFDLATECARLDPTEIWAGTPHLELLLTVAQHRPATGWVALLIPGSRPEAAATPALVLGLAQRLGLLVALTSDAVAARPGDLPAHRLLRRIAARYSDWRPEEYGLTGTRDTVIWDRATAVHWAGRYPEAARGARQVMEATAGRVDLTRQGWVMPPWPAPEGSDAATELTARARAGMRRRYGPFPPPAIPRRLAYELQVIGEHGYPAYFHVATDLVEQAHRWGLVTLGRGSVANSLVAYCLGLTEVDPMQHDLYFERFLNPARKSPPDIDIDFSWRARDRMLDYLFATYGADQAAMVGCVHTLHARGAYRETALALGLHPDQIALSKRLPHTRRPALQTLKERYPEVAHVPLEDAPVAEALQLAEALVGVPLSAGMHPCGIVLAPRPLTAYGPLDRCHKGYQMTHFDMFGVEEMGLVKLDVLATRGLGTVDTVRAVLRERGEPDPLEAPFAQYAGHPAARRLLRQGQSLGCFYTESPAMLSLNRKIRCASYEHLIATSSVIRPGVAESGMMDEYIGRHLGQKPIAHLHPLLGELLRETHGVMVYQEDVLKVAHHFGGMTLAEADLLRRAMSGKERSPIAMAPVEARFLAAATSRGIPQAHAAEVWRQIASFAGYAFCKAHSAAFARLSMQTCRLKAEATAPFMAAVLSNEGGYYAPHVYLEEARRWGLRISGPDVNGSQAEYWGYGTLLRVGLMAIRNLQHDSIARILTARAGRPFSDMVDFLHRTRTGPGGLDPSQVELLIVAGACDSLAPTRPEQLRLLLTHVKQCQALRERITLPLFPDRAETADNAPGASHRRDWSQDDKYARQLELLGLLPAMHPLTWLGPRLPPLAEGPPLIAARDLARYRGQRVRLRGLGVTRKLVTTRNGRDRMAFLSLEDPTAIAEVTLFPAAYRRCAAALQGWGPYVVTGVVDAQFGVASLTAQQVERVEVPASVQLPQGVTERFGEFGASGIIPGQGTAVIPGRAGRQAPPVAAPVAPSEGIRRQQA